MHMYIYIYICMYILYIYIISLNHLISDCIEDFTLSDRWTFSVPNPLGPLLATERIWDGKFWGCNSGVRKKWEVTNQNGISNLTNWCFYV